MLSQELLINWVFVGFLFKILYLAFTAFVSKCGK